MRTEKVNANAGLKIANPFKTSRTSTTNPFKYQDFEGNDISFKGNTLQYADVFEGYKPNFKGINKLKMVASSVAGSVTKIHSNVTESIVNFAKRIGNRLNSVWEYAKNTNKHIKDTIDNSILGRDIVDIGKDITNSISAKIKLPENYHLGWGDSIRETWSTMVNKLSHRKINSDLPVAELREMWVCENAKIAEEGKKVA